MTKLNNSLSPTTNILLIFVWAAMPAVFLFAVDPDVLVMLVVVGAALGVISGVMQHLSFMQATKSFLTATSILEVRSAFKATTWGARFIRFLYFSKFILIILSTVLIRKPLLTVIFGYFAGYFSLMFAREVVTLRDAFFLHRLSVNTSNSKSNEA